MDDERRGVHIVFVESAVLGQLRAAGEDHAGVDLQDDIRRARIASGDRAGHPLLFLLRRQSQPLRVAVML
jgi:hypothetical protein